MMINLSMFGAGRIGYVHALAAKNCAGVRIKNVYDIDTGAAQRISDIWGAKVCEDINQAIEDSEVHGYLIASPTHTHCALISEGCQRKKSVFCEKPIAMNQKEARECVSRIRDAGILCCMGFNRRYDPSFFELRERVRKGKIGQVQSVVITSRDPDFPSIDYLKTSGGLFRDMMIHDFDMARYLLGEEPVEIYATGSCLADKRLESFGDIDTASVILKTASGKICTINNNRRSGYGYDQRIEVLGSSGMLQADNKTPTTVRISNAEGVTGDQPEHFFLERYKDAYRIEIENFVNSLKGKAVPLANEIDGLNALIIADAAFESLKTGQALKLSLEHGKN